MNADRGEKKHCPLIHFDCLEGECRWWIFFEDKIGTITEMCVLQFIALAAVGAIKAGTEK